MISIILSFQIFAQELISNDCNVPDSFCRSFALESNVYVLKDFSVEIITPLTIGKVRRKELIEINESSNGKRGRQFSVIKVNIDKNATFRLTCVPDRSYIYFQNDTSTTLDDCLIIDIWNNLSGNSLAGQNRPDDLIMPVYRLYLYSKIPDYAGDGQVSGSIHLEFEYE